MKIVVHCGFPKTGTSSIQGAFARHRAALLDQGIHYPQVPPDDAHHVLIAIYDGWLPDNLIGQFGSRDAARAAALATWERIKAEVARHRPHTLVLSTELLFYGQDLSDYARLRDMLLELGDEIIMVAYVRAPAPHFLSALQQKAKTDADVMRPRPQRVRASIEAVEAAFGAPMILRVYEPAQLKDGDAITDFAQTVVGCRLPDDVAGQRLNQSLSSESVSISLANRRINFPDRDGYFDREQRWMLAMLSDLEREVPGNDRARLRPEVAAAITRASSDVLWLRDTRGIVFSGIDYDRIDGVMDEEIAARARIEDICELDPARRDALLLRLVAAGIEARVTLAKVQRTLPVDRILAARERARDLWSGLRLRRN